LADFYRGNNQFSKSQERLIAVLKSEENSTDTIAILKTHVGLGNLYIALDDNEKAQIHYEKALDLTIKIANWKYFPIICNNLGQVHENLSNFKKAKEFYLMGLSKENPTNLSPNYLNLLQNLGSAYYYLDNIDSAFYYNTQIKKIALNQNNSELLSGIYLNQGVYLEGYEDYKGAISSYKKGIAFAIETNDLFTIQNLNQNIMLCFGYLGNTDSLNHYFDINYELNQKIIRLKTDKAIHELSIQYEVEKKEQSLDLALKEQEKMELSNELKQTAIYILLAIIAIIGLLVFIFYILYQEKQKLIQLQVEAKNNEIESLIKDQEISIYSAQIEGVEKERKRIAQDLHDKIGGLLATIKLQFEGPDGINDKSIDNVKSLVNESIKTVRSISHDISDGRVDEMGLIPAIENLKSTVTDSGKITFDLFLDNYHNSLSVWKEREIFKVLLELLSNTLKHAEANHIVLQINVIDKSIHLTFEDNGVGFDHSEVIKGLGMRTISQRVDNLHGSWYIDSKPNHGSTVVIEIPLK
jgi:signal transduction histidine kinase